MDGVMPLMDFFKVLNELSETLGQQFTCLGTSPK